MKIGYNDIALKAISSVASSENTDHTHQNLFYGGKTIYWETAQAVTSSTITFDLGAGVTEPAEYFMVSGVNAMLAQTPGTLTIQLRASTDNFSTSDVLILEAADIAADDLTGTFSEDLIVAGELSDEYRYWQLKITSTNSIYHKLRALFFGEFFAFGGRAPKYPYIINQVVGASGFKSDAGTVFMTSSGRARYEGALTWAMVTDAVRNDFQEKIGQYLADFPIFIWEPENYGHTVFKNRLMCCYAQAITESGERWKDRNTITLSFVEDVIG